MKLIDRLILKASSLLPLLDLFVVSNESGEWKIGNEKFPNLKDAERYINNAVENIDDYTIIINDAGPGIERGVQIYGQNSVEARDSYRCTPDSKKSDEYGSQRRDGHEKGEYHHTWV